MRGLVLILLFSTVHMLQPEVPQRSTSLSSLVNAELTFARTCKQKGVRASFVEFFADDGIAFKPEPFRYKDAVKDLPPPANPTAFLLEWEPDVAFVAASGELGYTTGPSVRRDNTAKDKPQGYGQFFSVWKKQKDGYWKVAVDIGTDTPEQTASLGTPFKGVERVEATPTSSRKTEDERMSGVMDLEHELSKSSARDGVVRAYLLCSDDESRLHRGNEMPIVGREAIQLYLSKQTVVSAWKPIAGDVSLADDLGYTYGSYECIIEDSSVSEKGYYLHVWKRDAKGEWKLVADITNPQPTEKQN